MLTNAVRTLQACSVLLLIGYITLSYYSTMRFIVESDVYESNRRILDY